MFGSCPWYDSVRWSLYKYKCLLSVEGKGRSFKYLRGSFIHIYN